MTQEQEHTRALEAILADLYAYSDTARGRPSGTTWIHDAATRETQARLELAIVGHAPAACRAIRAVLDERSTPPRSSLAFDLRVLLERHGADKAARTDAAILTAYLLTNLQALTDIIKDKNP